MKTTVSESATLVPSKCDPRQYEADARTALTLRRHRLVNPSMGGRLASLARLATEKLRGTIYVDPAAHQPSLAMLLGEALFTISARPDLARRRESCSEVLLRFRR